MPVYHRPAIAQLRQKYQHDQATENQKQHAAITHIPCALQANMLEEAHGICAVALQIFGISYGVLDEAKYALLSYVMIAACRHCVFKSVGCAMRTAGSRSTTGKFGEYCFKWCAWRTLRFTHATLACLTPAPSACDPSTSFLENVCPLKSV